MAGTNSGFDAAAFNDAIHTVMEMAAPPITADRAKFYFPKTTTAPAHSGDGVPWDPADSPTVTQQAAIVVPCAVETVEAADQATRLGIERPNRLKVTLLDAEYQQVKGCEYLVMAGDRYDYRFTDPPTGLFDASVWTMWFTRSDA